jgi:hypothetical protein
VPRQRLTQTDPFLMVANFSNTVGKFDFSESRENRSAEPTSASIAAKIRGDMVFNVRYGGIAIRKVLY